MDPITSRSNPLLRRLRGLVERGTAGDLALLEGVRLIEEALDAGVEIVEVAASPRLESTPRGKQLLHRLATTGAPLRLVDDRLLASLSEVETSQGVLAVARRRVFEEDALYRGSALLVVAEAVQNPGNMGGLLRAAEAAGASGLYLTTGCADPASWKALRGAMGSAFRLPHIRGLDRQDILPRLAARGVASIATVPHGGVPYEGLDWTRPVALWLGSEGSGLSPEALAAASVQVTIPMAAPVESLNVAVAAGILLFEAARQRRRQH
jgi:RNA methyltransferase, TrmH family